MEPHDTGERTEGILSVLRNPRFLPVRQGPGGGGEFAEMLPVIHQNHPPMDQGERIQRQMYACSFTHALALDFMGDVEADVKLSYRTYNNYLRFYRSMFNWMKDKGYISDNPFNGIKRKPKKLIRKTRRTLTDEELSLLFGYLDSANRPYLAICLLCYCCLMRPKEIALLRCRDIDLGTQTVHVRGEIAKNDNDSYRTIPDEMMPYMRELDLSHPEWFLFGEHKQYDFSPGTQARPTTP